MENGISFQPGERLITVTEKVWRVGQGRKQYVTEKVWRVGQGRKQYVTEKFWRVGQGRK
jgi:hypothetical protein